MRLLRVLLVCCLLYGWIATSAADSSLSSKSKSLATAASASHRGMAVKRTASDFLDLVFHEQASNLDPQAWAVDDTGKVPMTLELGTMPQCLLTRSWLDNRGWMVKLYYQETPHLNLLVRVSIKFLATFKLGSINLSKYELVSYDVSRDTRHMKPVAIAIILPGSDSPNLRKALQQSLDNTFPILFQDQIPGRNATVADVRRWIKLWFLERGLSPKAATKSLNPSINRVQWDGKYLWTHGAYEMEVELKALGFSEGFAATLARDIVAARDRFDFSSVVLKLLPWTAVLILGGCLGYRYLHQ
ncbi:hypothetical protein N431DRAFT_473247 [Stipitochalara longipes BDJ]|nr:hypothetical protein N431DRAFT_473247 [Stipitochalara longipes BDJ]